MDISGSSVKSPSLLASGGPVSGHARNASSISAGDGSQQSHRSDDDADRLGGMWSRDEEVTGTLLGNFSSDSVVGSTIARFAVPLWALLAFQLETYHCIDDT
jgi:hypothetical protein